MFLTLEDYRSVCDEYELQQITQNDDTRLTAEAAAMEQIGSYLRHRYDSDRAFSAVGAERNAMLVQVAVNISLWLMIHRLPQSMGHRDILTAHCTSMALRQQPSALNTRSMS